MRRRLFWLSLVGIVLGVIALGSMVAFAQWPPTWTVTRTYSMVTPTSMIDVYEYPHVCVYAGLSPTYQGYHAVTSLTVVLKSDLPPGVPCR